MGIFLSFWFFFILKYQTLNTPTTPPVPTPAPANAPNPAGPALPAGATDTHAHVFDPARFAYEPQRRYTPGTATADQLLTGHAGLGIDRVVLVQPSVYGTDNACMLAAMARLGQARCRGIAVVDVAQVSRAELGSLHQSGVRGIRLNLEVNHETDPARVLTQLRAAARLIDLPGWCLQVHGAASLLPVVAQCLPHLRVPLVLDHFAGLRPDHAHPGADAPLRQVLDLLASGRVWVKLSAPYRASAAAPDHADLAPIARALFQAAPQRLLWGSDWPHTGGGGSRNRDPGAIEPFRPVDLAATLQALRRWAGDEATLHRILVDNPAALYGFAPVPKA